MSDWKENSNKRKDERNTKNPEVPQKAKASKKDTKKWCAGKMGREHTLEVKSFKDSKGWRTHFSNWWLLYCSKCGKEVDTYTPSWLTNKGAPKWLTDSGKFKNNPSGEGSE
jgi:hypothetical protein